MRPTTRQIVCSVLLALITVGLLATPLLPFVNRPTLWFGLPPIMVWMVVLVVAVTPVLAVLEAGRRDEDGARDDGGDDSIDEEPSR